MVKISEGSVRDALSLLDRGLLTLDQDEELDLKKAQEIFGYFDKAQLIDLFKLVLQGKEKKVIETYRKIYDQGIEPKIFINDFMELIYYFQNIDSLTLESTNFSLNEDEFKMIKEISKNIDNQVLILFWQFTIKVLEELDIVSNQNISIEMFLIRLMYLSSFKPKEKSLKKEDTSRYLKKADETNFISNFKTETINQIFGILKQL